MSRLSRSAVTLLLIEAICALRWRARPVSTQRLDEAFARATCV